MITISRAAQIAVDQALIQNPEVTLKYAKRIAKKIRILLNQSELCKIETLAEKVEFEREFLRLLATRL